jgi:iron complex transport system substrate-binding protein
MCGVELPSLEVARVASLQPSATVILERIGVLDRLVACTRHCLSLCPAAAGRVIVDDSWTAQADQIRAARPDMVIASVPYQAEAVSEILRAGVRFLGLAPRTLADIYRDIQIIANLFGRVERGLEVVQSMQDAIADVRGFAAAGPRRRVYCEEWGKPILRSQPWVAELVDAAGGEFLGMPGTQVSVEEIEAADPDVIIAAWCGAGDRVPLEKLVRTRNWLDLRAVYEGRVYCIRDELLTTPAPTLIDGLHALAAAIHPELFEGVPGLRRIAGVHKDVLDT